MKPNLKIRLFTIFSIITLCFGVTTKSLQNDTFYIIKLGEDILKNGIDLLDHYSWINNLSYTYPHWLYDVIIYLIYSKSGYLGIYISSIILYIILILSIYIINLKINKNELMATIISLISIPCLTGFVTARAQLVTAILFLWQVYLIENTIKTGNKKNIIYLTIISLLVANLHATIWLFYFILYLPFIGQHITYMILKKSKKRKFNNTKLLITEIKNIKLLVISAISGFIMGFLTPSKICFSYIFKVMQGNSQDYIMEHAPMILVENWTFLIFVTLILIILIFSNTKIKLKELFMISGLILMSLCSIRHVIFFDIIGLLYTSILCNRYLIEKKDYTLKILSNLFTKNKLIYIFSFILIFCMSYYKFNENFSKSYIPIKEYPVDAVEFIKNDLKDDKINIYNDYNIGSYLLFNDIKVFIDSRCDLYLKEFNGLKYSIFDDAANIEKNYEKKFKYYEVTHILTSNKTMLHRIISKDKDYTILYKDKYFTLFKGDVDEK